MPEDGHKERAGRPDALPRRVPGSAGFTSRRGIRRGVLPAHALRSGDGHNAEVPAQAESAGMEPARIEPAARIEPTPAAAAQAEPMRAEPAQAEAAQVARAEPAQVARAEPAQVARAELAQAEPPRSEPAQVAAAMAAPAAAGLPIAAALPR